MSAEARTTPRALVAGPFRLGAWPRGGGSVAGGARGGGGGLREVGGGDVWVGVLGGGRGGTGGGVCVVRRSVLVFFLDGIVGSSGATRAGAVVLVVSVSGRWRV